jgi:hypothetical protein
MDFSKDDQFLKNLMSYRRFHNILMDKSLKYKIDINKKNIDGSNLNVEVTFNGIKKECTFIALGIFKNKTFTWMNDINVILYEHLLLFHKYNNLEVEKYVSKELLDYLFLRKNILVGEKGGNILPYLIAITNPEFNVIRFSNKDEKFYALIKLNIEDNFDYYRDFISHFVNIE